MQNLEDLYGLLRLSQWMGPDQWRVSPQTYLSIYQSYRSFLDSAKFIPPNELKEGFGEVLVTFKHDALNGTRAEFTRRAA